MKIHLAYVDDSKVHRSGIKSFLESKAFTDANYPKQKFEFVVKAYPGEKEFLAEKQFIPDMLLLDIDLASGDEFHESKNILQYMNQAFPDATVVMYSGNDSTDIVVEFMTLGAQNFISKNDNIENLHRSLIQSYEVSKIKEKIFSKASIEVIGDFTGDFVRSQYKRVERIVRDRSFRSVLFFGETGTGKEVLKNLFKFMVYEINGKKTPFESINCGAIPEQLIESELFGSKKGAFTGAVEKRGIFEKAHGGWIFLDEVADLSPSAQNALLRVIENNEMRRVGSPEITKINVRVISASNKNLKELAKEGRFRQDLIQRLNTVEFFLPPLRERGEEEIEEFLNYFASKKDTIIPPTTMHLLKKYSWKEGNVREMKNTMTAMSELAVSDNTIHPIAVPKHILTDIREQKSKLASKEMEGKDFSVDISPSNCDLEQLTLQAFAKIYELYKNETIYKISELAGISHMTGRKKLKACIKRGYIKEIKKN